MLIKTIMMSLLRIITSVLILGVLMTACSSIFGSEDDTIRLRLDNETGFDFEEISIRITVDDGTDEPLQEELIYPALPHGETSDYQELPFDPDVLSENYWFLTQAAFSDRNPDLLFRISLLRFPSDTTRTVELSPGSYTYQLRFTEQDYLTYQVLGDEDSETGETEVRIYNASDINYSSVLVKRYKADETSSEYIDFGPVMSGEFTGYKAVENAIQHTIIEITTEDGEQVDNDPPDHFGNELDPGKYTYEVNVLTSDRNDISRIVRD